jgi:hypothetical protein
VQPRDRPPQTDGLIVKASDPNTSFHEAKRLIKEAADPKALQLRVRKLKDLANNSFLVECKSKIVRDFLEKGLDK